MIIVDDTRGYGGIQTWMQCIENLFCCKRMSWWSPKCWIRLPLSNEVIFSNFKYCLVLLPMIFFKGIKVKVYLHGNEFYSFSFPLFSFLSRFFGFTLVTNSKFCRRFLYFNFGLTANVEVPLAKVSKSSSPTEVLFDFIFVGRLVPRKQPVETLLLLNKYAQSLSIVLKVCVVGEGPERASIERLNLPYLQVVLHGEVESDRRDILIQSSLNLIMLSKLKKGMIEGFGISYLEANLLGTRAIGIAAGGARDALLLHKDNIRLKNEEELLSVSLTRIRKPLAVTSS